MLGATVTTSGPVVAAEGIVMVMEEAPHELTVTAAPPKVTTLLPCEAPKLEPEIIT
jgi:hypothetical protein